MSVMRSACLILDSSSAMSDARQLDLNGLSLISDAVARLYQDEWQVTIVLAGEALVGLERAGPLKGVTAERRYNVLRSIGKPILERWVSAMLQERSLKSAVLPIARRAFAEREQYQTIREVLVSLHANHYVPLIWDETYSMSPYAQRFGEGEQVGSLLSGMLGVDCCIMVFRVSPIIPADASVPWAPLLTATDAAAIQLYLDSGQLVPNAVSLERVESLMASARLLRSIGIPLYWLTPQQLSLFPFDTRDVIAFSADAKTRLTGVRRWLSSGAVPRGVIVASPQAALSLVNEHRGSLLGAGVVSVRGDFRKDDVIAIEDEGGSLLGYGVCRFGAQDVTEVRGKKEVVVVHANYFFGLPPPFINDEHVATATD